MTNSRDRTTSSIREEVVRTLADSDVFLAKWDCGEPVEADRTEILTVADAVITATLNALLADLDERGFSIALWQAHDRHSIRRWIEGHREGQKWTRS